MPAHPSTSQLNATSREEGRIRQLEQTHYHFQQSRIYKQATSSPLMFTELHRNADLCP